MDIPVLDISRKSCVLINRYSSNSLMVIDDPILQRKGKHSEGPGWVFGHSYGMLVLGMQYVTAIVSGNEGIFPLILDLKTKNGLSKIVTQMVVIKQSIPAGIRFMVL
ncbi:MAG: hypothetical protein ACYCPR_02985 [Thermoplasmataceae archaeon]